MRDKALYIIIGALIGVVIMQAKQGPQPAQAQAGATIVGFIYGGSTPAHYVATENGDVYYRRLPNPTTYNYTLDEYQLHYVGNFWGEAPVPVSNETWGEMKSRYDDGKK